MNITIIIPVHEYNDDVSRYLPKSIESINNQIGIDIKPTIIFVAPKEIYESINTLLGDTEYQFIANPNGSDYQSQVNYAVEHVKTDYFTILEFDDEFAQTYFKNANTYINSYPDVDIFLSMMIEVNERNEGIKLTNDSVWSQQFVGENGEMGYLNISSLKQYTDFKLSGAIIKKSEFINIGMFKLNIKLSFGYELILRALNNACKIFSIPKIGYKHLATREKSLFSRYLKEMSVPERKFWFETATKEANFNSDRILDISKLEKPLAVKK